jgi:hypothetical protein
MAILYGQNHFEFSNPAGAIHPIFHVRQAGSPRGLFTSLEYRPCQYLQRFTYLGDWPRSGFSVIGFFKTMRQCISTCPRLIEITFRLLIDDIRKLEEDLQVGGTGSLRLILEEFTHKWTRLPTRDPLRKFNITKMDFERGNETQNWLGSSNSIVLTLCLMKNGRRAVPRQRSTSLHKTENYENGFMSTQELF